MSDLERLGDILFPEVPHEGFVVDTAAKVEWALAKIGQAEERVQAREAQAKAWKTRIDEWLENTNTADKRDIENFIAMIRPWAELEIAKLGKKRSMKMLGGEVGFRQSPPRLEVTDEKAAVDFCEEHSAVEWAECVRVKKEIRKDEVKKLIKETGEVPDGVKLVAGEVKFYVDTTEARKALK